MRTLKNNCARKLSRTLSIVYHGVFKKRAYLKSSHAEEYEEIASKNGVNPGYVYAIAHCQKSPGVEDFNILKELRIKEIIV